MRLRPASWGGLPGAGDGGAGHEGFEATAPAAAARMPVDLVVRGMAEVAGEAVLAAVEPPVQEQVAAVAGADGGPGEAALVYSKAPDRFGQQRLPHIGGDADRQLKALADQLAEG